MSRAFVLLTLFALGAAATGAVIACDHQTADEGRDASLQIADAQFVREPMPGESGGPRVQSLTVGATYRAGDVDRSISGDLERSAVAVAITFAGDVGYWIVPAGQPSAADLASPTYGALLSFAPSLRTGTRMLVVRAVDADKRFGPSAERPLRIVERGEATGRLVVSLGWNNRADLDLHVVLPDGVEVFKRNPTSWERPPPGTPPTSTTNDGGVLDFDSNADCVPDGRRAENVVWQDPPPKGHYLVRVDTFSLCGEPSAEWRAKVTLEGNVLAEARGRSTEIDQSFTHDRGDGLLVLEFDVP